MTTRMERIAAMVAGAAIVFLLSTDPTRASAQTFSEDFDGVTAPMLPTGWVATTAQGSGPGWATDATNPDTPLNSAYVKCPLVDAEWTLDSPPISIATTAAQLTFRHEYSFSWYWSSAPEGSFEGLAPEESPVGSGALEISIGGGAFQDILAAGGSFVAGGYTIAWYYSSGLGYSPVVVNLPAAAGGTTIVLRWHEFAHANPEAFGGAGWWIDSIQICDGYPCDAVPKPALLQVDTSGNGVWEPGETVDVRPGYINNGDGALILDGTASSLTGPAGAAYGIVDPAAYYDIPTGFFGSCSDTNDCYSFSVDDPAVRPAAHWDASFRENLTNGLGVTRLLHVGESFGDVPPSNLFYPFVETIFHNGVTGGCAGGSYCPDATTVRKQMAVFVLKAKFGRSYEPPACTGVFADVACPGPFTNWIEDLYARGIAAGCGAGPIYCPDAPVSRQQMAVFLLKTRQGSTYVPPECTGVFPDVPCSSPFAPWIEDLYFRNIAAGCSGGNFCPTAATTRGQMAPFLVKTFALLLYGP